MDEKPPSPDSMRTLQRAVALAWARGCDGQNPCWPECLDAARSTILDGQLDEWERDKATTSAYWHYTNVAG